MKETSCPSCRVPLATSCWYTWSLSSPDAMQTVFSNCTEGSHTTQGRTAEKEAICGGELNLAKYSAVPLNMVKSCVGLSSSSRNFA